MNAKAVLILAIETLENAHKISRTGMLPEQVAEDLIVAAAEAIWKLRLRVLDVSDIPFFDIYDDEILKAA